VVERLAPPDEWHRFNQTYRWHDTSILGIESASFAPASGIRLLFAWTLKCPCDGNQGLRSCIPSFRALARPGCESRSLLMSGRSRVPHRSGAESSIRTGFPRDGGPVASGGLHTPSAAAPTAHVLRKSRRLADITTSAGLKPRAGRRVSLGPPFHLARADWAESKMAAIETRCSGFAIA
jgi:hypothetical protein